MSNGSGTDNIDSRRHRFGRAASRTQVRDVVVSGIQPHKCLGLSRIV